MADQSRGSSALHVRPAGAARPGRVAASTHRPRSSVRRSWSSVVVLAARRDAGGMLVAVAIATAALLLVFFKVRGRTLEAWTPVIARYLARRLTGRLRYRSAAPTAGLLLRPNGSVEVAVSLPEELGDVELVAAPVDPAGTAAIGVVKDRRGQTFTATLGVRVRNFALLVRRRAGAPAGCLRDGAGGVGAR